MNAVTPTKTGRYLLTPTVWSSDEMQSLFAVSDRDELLNEMASIFQCEVSELDQPAEVYIEVFQDGTFEIGSNDRRYTINGEGWVVNA